jgi:NAD(P)-dependent dehydrogenase (short-subunit alcohol dehydrogenase family)
VNASIEARQSLCLLIEIRIVVQLKYQGQYKGFRNRGRYMPTVLITGANRGIGAEFVKQYSSAGWRVHACFRSLDKAEALRNLAAIPHSNIMLHQIDLSDFEQIDMLALTLTNETIDILINNAGIFPDKGSKGFKDTDYDMWSYAFRVNSMAPLRMAEALIEHVAKSSEKKIVFISSKVGSISANTTGAHYAHRSSKVALNMVAKSLSIDLAPRGISIATIEPGWVRSDMGGNSAPISPEESVSGMTKIIEHLNPRNSGEFVSYNGQKLSW